jgi:hypothetical protein
LVCFLAPVTLHSGTEFCTFLFIIVDYGGGLISPGLGVVMAYLEERKSNLLEGDTILTIDFVYLYSH